jgi:hypothetical protein
LTEETNAAPADTSAPVDHGGALTASEAAAMLTSRRENPAAEPPARERAPAPRASDEEDDDSAPAKAPAESEDTEAQPDPEIDTPSVEPPRSWTKEDKEAFKALPPDIQQRIAERERAREVEVRRGQNETAEARKAAQAEHQRLEQARTQYERALPALLDTLQQQQQGEFSDIKSWDDVTRLAEEDPFRFAKFQANQARIQDVQRRMSEAQTRQQREAQDSFARFADEQDRLFLEKAPEFADAKTAEKARTEAAKFLTETVGFEQSELAAMWNGEKGLSLRDARAQSLVRDAMKWRSAQTAAKAAAAKPVPPVQKPGVASSPRDAASSNIQALERNLERTGSLRDAAALLAARRRA